MVATSPILWLQMALIAGAVSFAILWLLGRFGPGAPRAAAMAPPPGDTACYLFQGNLMFDHDAGALPDGADDAMSWHQLRDWLSPRFSDLPDSLSDLDENAPLLARPRSDDDTAQLHLSRRAGSTRVALTDPPHVCPAERHEMLVAKARMDDTAEAFDGAPHPIWKASSDGTILWQNAACRAAFDPTTHMGDDPAPESGQSRTSRFSVVPDDSARPRWYELHTAAHHWGALYHATDITKVVSAEKMQKDFVQTLTKTFAYLTIGLAVFDRNRKLALFNPALVDLTSLGAEFLSGQPDLMAFFDCLRDRRVMPEPRSYASWRTQISEVIDAAEGGLYQETWSLPNDVTFRVTGRPHPDGAVAFLFEDISAEVMLARRFRSQVDLRQSALDSLPEAVMVIGPNNVLAFCNTAATGLLRIDPDTCFADMTVSDLMRACEDALPAPAVWPMVEDSLRQRQQDGPLRKTVEIAPGHSLIYRVEVLPGGARMLMLHSRADAAPKPAAQLVAG